MQAAAHNGKYDIVRQAGMDLVKIHHDLENEKPPRPIVQKPAPPLNYHQLPPKPLNPFYLVQKSPSPLNSSAISPKPPRQPFSTGSKMRADASAGPKSGFKMRTAVFKWL